MAHGNGFVATQDRYSERDFGNWLRDFIGPGVGVRVIRDRGEWFIEGRLPASPWFSMQAWSECLNGGHGIDAGVQEQMDFVRRSLDRMQEAGGRGAAIENCLERQQKNVLAAEIALPPGLDPNQPSLLKPSIDAKAVQREAAARLARQRSKRGSQQALGDRLLELKSSKQPTRGLKSFSRRVSS